MRSCFLLQYETPTESAPSNPGAPAGTSTFTTSQLEGGDTDFGLYSRSVDSSAPTGTGTFTSTGREAPDRDYVATGVEFVFPL